jgi:hypothetical protein
MGRLPMAQPPGSETVASPIRASIGPSTRIEARILRTSSYGATVDVIRVAASVITRPKSSGRVPAMVVDAPNWLSRCWNPSMSARRGRFRRVSGSSVSSAQGSRVSAAFFAPEIGMVPERRLPPWMMILSIGAV